MLHVVEGTRTWYMLDIIPLPRTCIPSNIPHGPLPACPHLHHHLGIISPELLPGIVLPLLGEPAAIFLFDTLLDFCLTMPQRNPVIRSSREGGEELGGASAVHLFLHALGESQREAGVDKGVLAARVSPVPASKVGGPD
jgi:hypothetical protein